MSKKFSEDYELIYLISQGDEYALEQLINKYKGMILRSLDEYRGMLMDKFDRTELYQLSLISLYQAIMTYNENMNCSFFTYLRIVVHRDILAYVRMLNRDRNKANLYAISLDQTIKESDGIYLIDTIQNNQREFNPKDYLNIKQLYILIQKQLSTFTDEEQRIFILWFNGYRYEEIMVITGVAMHRISYVVAKVKKKLKGSIDYKDAL